MSVEDKEQKNAFNQLDSNNSTNADKILSQTQNEFPNDVQETELDFEAEEPNIINNKGSMDVNKLTKKFYDDDEEGECKSPQVGFIKDLEEGELEDGDEKTLMEMKPVCRFFSRGQCTWGSNCRFLHPGVTDKGNYNMFSSPKQLFSSSNFQTDFNYTNYNAKTLENDIADPQRYADESLPLPETAWERGLRLSKERIKRAMIKKETDIDFEDKKLNLSIGQDELDQENDYYSNARQPSPVYPQERYNDELDPYDRQTLEYWRKARNYVNKPKNYENLEIHVKSEPDKEERERIILKKEQLEKDIHSKRSFEVKLDKENDFLKEKNTKIKDSVCIPSSWKEDRYDEVIQVQKSRADEWADPWMRRKSPKHNNRLRRGKSLSDSSHSSSGSSRSSSRSSDRSSSSSSSYSSHSNSFSSHSSESSIIDSSTTIKKKIKAGNHSSKKTVGANKQSANRPFPPPGVQVSKFNSAFVKHSSLESETKHHKRSSSESSSSSSSSSSTKSSSLKANRSLHSSSSTTALSKNISSQEPLPPGSSRDGNFIKPTPKGIDPLKVSGQKQQIRLTLKGLAESHDKEDLKFFQKTSLLPESIREKKKPLQPATSSIKGNVTTIGRTLTKKSSSNRREELLKQLKAVEDAIARKKTKLTH